MNYYKDESCKVYAFNCWQVKQGLVPVDLIAITEEEAYSTCNPEPCLDECRRSKLAEMRVECGDHIDAGFDCDALGYECQYANTIYRQIEMRDAITAGGGKIWRNESYTLHTTEQATSVELVSISEKTRHKQTYANKCAYIDDPARTSDEINAVTWDSVE